ncbi:MAG: signal peptidase II [Terrisporobacter othiniensis]|uniref:signal peptidase II n=1 Tax=Terrisporobacter othiniensis TaxID=1577792 RepID=UPI00290B5CEC|nr:signal peptidase II [Terrisporobacter othiniensis]MDU6985561.1 signal peptidase II [Terrisporobacter othiniensis]
MYEVIVAILIGLDQIIKYWALNYLQVVESIPVINNIFNLTYVENRGAAFGMLQNNQTIFIVVAAIASCYGIYYLHTKKMNNIGKIGIILVISGAIGNLIDRVRLGFVVDYLDFHIIWNYVFNLADCLVVVGTILLCIYIITSEEDKKQVK